MVASLEHIAKYDGVIERLVRAGGYHAGKLNLLAQEISHEADGDDLIMFLDGDAFPIADPMPLVHEALDHSILVAVRRDENLDDRQPHPCFCVIRVKDWNRIGGDWSEGYLWQAENKLVSDVGGNVLGALERRGLEWTPLLRSNTVDLHPLWFGVYGDVVYHHGSGFRPAFSRRDLADVPDWRFPPRFRQRHLERVSNGVRRLRFERFKGMREHESAALSDMVFNWIREDDEFHRRFVDGDRRAS